MYEFGAGYIGTHFLDFWNMNLKRILLGGNCY